MKIKPIVWILVLLILTSSVFALGIRPAKTTINFEPDLEKEYVFYIVNNENQPLTITLKADGLLKDYISFEKQEITLIPEESLKEVKFKVSLPQALTPGLNLGEIIVTETQSKITGAMTGMISANLQLIHKIFVIAPYPEKYVDVDIKLRMRDIESDIITEIRNSGTQNLNEVLTLIEVFNNNKKIKELKTPPLALEPAQTKQYYLTLGHDELPNGEYDVDVQVWYDNEELKVTRKLLAGEPKIEVLNLEKFFLEKEINDLKIEVQSQWNKEIKDIYADIVVQRNGQTLYSDKTVAFNLKAEENKVIKTYIDATNIEAGEADLYITFHHNEKKDGYQTQIEFLTEKDYQGQTKIIEMPGGRFTYVILIILVLLIAAILVVIIIPSKRKKQEIAQQQENNQIK